MHNVGTDFRKKWDRSEGRGRLEMFRVKISISSNQTRTQDFSEGGGIKFYKYDNFERA